VLLPSNPACVLVQMEARTLGDMPAYRRMARLDLGGVAIARIASVPQEVTALLSEVAPGAEDCVQFQVVHSGEMVLRQGGRDVSVRERSAVLYDAGRPFDFVYNTDFVTSIIQIPKRVIGLSAARLAALSTTPLSVESAAGSVLNVLLKQAGHVTDEAVDGPRDAVAQALVEVVTMITDSAAGRHSVGVLHRQHLREAARDHIVARLADDALGPASIARALHVSVRGLHAAFDGEPETLGRLIARLRFERATALLSDPSLAVEQVARESGHRSAAHLARVFRERTGEPLEQWRAGLLGAAVRS